MDGDERAAILDRALALQRQAVAAEGAVADLRRARVEDRRSALRVVGVERAAVDDEHAVEGAEDRAATEPVDGSADVVVEARIEHREPAGAAYAAAEVVQHAVADAQAAQREVAVGGDAKAAHVGAAADLHQRVAAGRGVAGDAAAVDRDVLVDDDFAREFEHDAIGERDRAAVAQPGNGRAQRAGAVVGVAGDDGVADAAGRWRCRCGVSALGE
ncbi:hypothetical protein [Dokdonella fugitiva]|uniref:hypothetical protein n=1 Tax=Dokdonella fugitiva TaxID=328517 RepID=UPI003D18B83B